MYFWYFKNVLRTFEELLIKELILVISTI